MQQRPRKRKVNDHLPYRMVINKNVYYFLRPLDNNRHRAIPLGHVREPDRSPDESLKIALGNYARLVEEITGRETLDLLVDQWLERKTAEYEPDTVKKYRKMGSRIKKGLGHFRVNEIRHADIARFLDNNFADRPFSANGYKSLLSIMFKWAVRRGMRETNPTRELEQMKEPTRVRYINDEELKYIVAASSPMIAVLIQLAAITGQRIGDLLALEWSAISDQSILVPEFEDLGDLSTSVGLVFYPAKIRKTTGKKVPIAMTPQLREVLLQAMAIPTAKKEFVICKRDGSRYAYEGARSGFKRAVERALRYYLQDCIARNRKPRAGMFENLHFHDLKCRALTDAENQKLDAQGIGGHASATTTKKYYIAADIEGSPTNFLTPPKIDFGR